MRRLGGTGAKKEDDGQHIELHGIPRWFKVTKEGPPDLFFNAVAAAPLSSRSRQKSRAPKYQKQQCKLLSEALSPKKISRSCGACYPAEWPPSGSGRLGGGTSQGSASPSSNAPAPPAT